MGLHVAGCRQPVIALTLEDARLPGGKLDFPLTDLTSDEISALSEMLGAILNG
jgi:hypothetical protein